MPIYLNAAPFVVRFLGYIIGYATETARALIEFAFVAHGAHRVFTYCDLDNLASARVLEKAGMQREGLIRESDWSRSAWHDEYLYAILRREWQQR